MKSKIRRTKIGIYTILFAATAVFAVMSFFFFSNDLDSRVTPQVSRAMVQVSRILPQLEGNEQALRDANDIIEKSRKTIRLNDGLDAEFTDEGENVETVIDHTLSWMNRVTGLRVGRNGHVVVVSREDFSILAHPNERLVGKGIYPASADIDVSTIPSIEEISAQIDSQEDSEYDAGSASDLNFELYLFFPENLKKENEDDQWLDPIDEGIYASCFSYKDTFILCGVTLRELLEFTILRCLFSTVIFFAIMWIFVRYIGFTLIWQKEDKKQYKGKLASYALVVVAIMFGGIWYFQSMEDMTGDIATMNEHAQVAVETIETYKAYINELSGWLDEQYLTQCRLAAQMVKSRGKENLTRKDLAAFAKELGVKYIYVFDKTGKVMVTNSPYDHFVLSRNSSDQSYAFRPLLEGREYVIQDVMSDESEGEALQYVGVSLRDENDLADGFVQIAVEPDIRERLIDPINIQTVLDNLVIGLPDYALAIDKASMDIVATTGIGYDNAGIEELGIDKEKIKSGYNGIFLINGYTYYGGVSDTEELFLMPIVRSTDDTNNIFIALKSALFTIAVCVILVLWASFGYGLILSAKEVEEAKKEQNEPVKEKLDTSDEEEDEERGIFRNLQDMIKVQEKFGFERRWKEQSCVPPEEQNPEMRTGRIIYRILLAFSIWLVLFEVAYVTVGGSDGNLTGIAYVLRGNWDTGLNLFSFTYCLFLLCVLYVFQDVANRVLYRIAKITDLRTETILLLLRNAVKYGCALFFLYMGLAKFGVDTRALWASAGVLSLMVGFGAKDLVNDIIAGIFIIFEGTFKIGDFVMVGNWGGMVEEIGIRTTRVSFFSDTKIFNNSSLRDIVNYNGEVAREVVKIPIHYETDILEVEKLLADELPKMAENIPGLVKPPRYDGVGSFEENCIMLRIKLFTIPFRRKRAVRALLREVKLLFDKNGISLPYNHMVLMNYDKERDKFVYTPEEASEEDVDGQE